MVWPITEILDKEIILGGMRKAVKPVSKKKKATAQKRPPLMKPLRRYLIDGAANPTAIAEVPSTNCHAIEVPVTAEGKAGVVGISASRAAREGMRHCAGPAPGGVWRQLEHDPLPFPTEISCPVHVSGRVS